MQDLSSVKEKVKKLLALSESPNSSEAAVALEKANKILREFNIEMKDIDLSPAKEILIETYTEGYAEKDNETILINVIAQYNFCEAIRSTSVDTINNRKKTHYKVLLIGRKANIESTHVLCDYIFDAMEKNAKKDAYGKGREVVHSYKVGFCTSLINRINYLIEKNKNDGEDCKSLVISTQQENKKFIEDTYGQPTPGKKPNIDAKDVTAYFAGFLAGQSLSLNQQIGANNE